jgi:hypothetical protein
MNTLAGRDTLIAEAAAFDNDRYTPRVDVTAILESLLLFNSYILQSARLTELPVLIRQVGFDNMLLLLESNSFNIHCDATVLAQTGQTATEARQEKGLLPWSSYSFYRFGVRDREEFLVQCLAKVRSMTDLTAEQFDRLETAVRMRLVPVDDQAGSLRLETFRQDLRRNIPTISDAVAISLTDKMQYQVRPSDFTIRIHPLDESDFRVESDIGTRMGFDAQVTHLLIERALLSVSELNKRVECMQTYDALTGFRHQDLPLFESKIDFLIREIDPTAQARRLRRVIALTDVPDLGESVGNGSLDMQRLLEIRESVECRAFRNWLKLTDRQTDDEVMEQFHPVRDRLLLFARGVPGKIIRWAASNAISLMAAGPAPAVAFTTADSFIIDRLIPTPGPTAFLSVLYPSLFGTSSI